MENFDTVGDSVELLKEDDKSFFSQYKIIGIVSIAIALITTAICTPVLLLVNNSNGVDSSIKNSPAEWLRLNAVNISSDSIYDTDYEDLQSLKVTLANATVVFLGENDHGVGISSSSRSRIIRFLHEEMGFNTVAWERDFTYSPHVNAALANLTRDQLSDYAQYVDPIFSRYLGPTYMGSPSAAWWSNSKETKNILWYIANSTFTSSPLELVGFEWCAYDPLDTTDLQWFLNTTLVGIHRPNQAYFDLWANITNYYYTYNQYTLHSLYPPPCPSEQTYFWDTYHTTMEYITHAGNPWNISNLEYWIQLYNSSSTFAQAVFLNQTNPNLLVMVQNLRNAQMGRNIAWWTNQPTYITGQPRKIAVFTHHFHANQNLSSIEYTRGKNAQASTFWESSCYNHHPCELVTAGTWTKTLLGSERVYTIGGTAWGGQYSPGTCGASTYNITASNDTLEHAFHEAGFPVAAFLDLRTSALPDWLTNTISTLSVGYFEPLEVSLSMIWDGILYYPVEHKCTYLP